MTPSHVREIAKTTLRNLEPRQKFKPGVVEDAVKRAEGLSDFEQVVDAIEAAFLANKISINQNWDGSIG